MAPTRSRTKALIHLLETSPLPVYVVDSQRRIAYCNAACAAWAGVEPDRLVGRRCDYHSAPADGEEQAAAGLCPPPEAFLGRRLTAAVAATPPPGEMVKRRAEFLPLGGEDPERIGVLVVVHSTDLDPLQEAPLDRADAESEALHERLRDFRRRTAARYQIRELVGDSPAMRRVREQVWIAAQHRTRVLILGPAGSGREHVARTIYYSQQPEAIGPLTPLSCSLLDAELLHATVTAFLRQCAELETEQPAALLLLDADELAPDAQAVLADVLNIAEFNVPTLATARQALLKLADENRFRRDLACAMSTLVIELPPLVQRPQDIPLLAQMFLEEANAAGGRQLSGFTPEAVDLLAAHPWPGNVDELAELVRQACRRAEGVAVTSSDLPSQVGLAAQAAARPPRVEETIILDEFLEEIEAEVIRRALEIARGNKAKAARLLGVSRARLHRRVERLGANPK